MLDIEYKRDLKSNYMVFNSQQDLSIREQYQVKMITRNHLHNFLNCHIQVIDDNLKFYYEITSRQPLDRCFENEDIGSMELERLLLCLKQAFDTAGAYLLCMDDIVLNPKFIYMDIETYEVFFCYLPGYEKPIQESFHELAEYILNGLDHKDKEAVHRGYEIYRLSMQENYSMEDILQIGFQDISEEEGYDECEKNQNLDKEEMDLDDRFGNQGYSENGGYSKKERYLKNEKHLENESFSENELHSEEKGNSRRHKNHRVNSKRRKNNLKIWLTILSILILGSGVLYGGAYYLLDQEILKNYGQWMKILGGAAVFIGIIIYATIGEKKSRKKSECSKDIIGGKINKNKQVNVDDVKNKKINGKGINGKGISGKEIKAKEIIKAKELRTNEIRTNEIGTNGIKAKELRTNGTTTKEIRSNEIRVNKTKYEKLRKDNMEDTMRENIKDSIREKRQKNFILLLCSKLRTKFNPIKTRNYEGFTSASYSPINRGKGRGYKEGNQEVFVHGEENFMAERFHSAPVKVSKDILSEPFQSLEKQIQDKKQTQTDYGMTTFLNAQEHNKERCLFSVQPEIYPDIPLNKNSITIGKKNTLVDAVIDNPLISRIHAKIIKEGEEYYLLDLNSTNGTYLNGELFYGNQKYLLHDFDEIIFANIMYHFGSV